MHYQTSRRNWLFLFLPVLFALACTQLFAQANSNITGIVSDQSGAVIAGANITLTDLTTGATKATTSSETGLYDMAGLNAGTYNMTVAAKGFQTFVQNGIVVNVSATFRVDPKLTVGAESTTITVQADALTVQSDSNVVSTLISEQQITELATANRNVVALATLGLGVSGNLPDSNTPTSVGSSFAISFNGLNQAHNIWLIDGGEAYDRGSGGMHWANSRCSPATIRLITVSLPVAPFRCRSREVRRRFTARCGNSFETTPFKRTTTSITTHRQGLPRTSRNSV